MTTHVVHMRDTRDKEATLCGLPWEDWQAPMPSNEEIGFESLSYGAKVLVRQSDEQRKPKAGDIMVQCQACFKAAKKEIES